MKLSTLGAVSAAFAVCATAGAQTKAYEPIGVSVRLGAFLPTNSKTNDVVGTAIFAYGADYRIQAKTPRLFERDSYLSASVDVYRRDGVGNIPVTLNYVVMSGRYSFNLGAGVGFESLPGRDKTGFAYAAGIAYEIPGSSTLPLFVQAKFLGADRSELNGFGLYVGVRF